VPPSQLIWLRASRTADALWAAEQVLRSGSCGALLFWPGHERQNQVRSDSLRRLHLAAQGGETLFFMLRPLAAGQDASPAPLRLALRPQAGGIEIDFVKRRGPQRDAPLFLPLSSNITYTHRHAPVDRPVTAPATARGLQPQLVH
jgi:protein ImuA